MLMPRLGVAALAALGIALALHLLNEIRLLYVLGVFALDLSIPHEPASWVGFNLLRELLSPHLHGWRRPKGRRGMPVRHISACSQLPHLGSVHAADSALELEQAFRRRALDSGVEDRIVNPNKVVRYDYTPPSFEIDSFRLLFKLDLEDTKVMSRLVLRRVAFTRPQDLILDGEELVLDELLLDNRVLQEDPHRGYRFVHGGKLLIPKHLLPEEADVPFELLIHVSINPTKNLWRRGLFVSQDNLVTQCEPGGFRRITYFLDRPDVLTPFRVRLEADAEKFPVLLSNGNKLAWGPLDWSPERHFVVFEDPYPKPGDYFGLVAGKFGVLRDSFCTELFSRPEFLQKLHWARECLKKSIRWDEENFGREYDLDTLNVVCVEDFGGQMANKGLFIFDCDTLLADPWTSTDAELNKVMSAVSHEYFRNWSGSRVAVRDRFQLSLNSGLTKFRESLFTAAMTAPGARRVSSIRYIISEIFRSDESPYAQPLRPESYEDVYDLYNPTANWKAAEVMRAYQSLLGEDGFRRGLDLYFERHDGEAVTIEDFRRAMEDANNRDLWQFDRWYSQAGTPEVRVEQAMYNPSFKTFSVTFTQSTPPTPSQPTKLPFMIPIKLGLIGKQSKRDLLNPPTMVVTLTSEKKTVLVFDVEEDCVLSVHRDFAAPIRLYDRLAEENRAFLLAYDSDPVNKWRSAKVLYFSVILSRAVVARQDAAAEFTPLPAYFIDALKTVLVDERTYESVKALVLRVPKIHELAGRFRPTDPDALHRARRSVILEIASALKDEMLMLYEDMEDFGARCHGPEELSRRQLRNGLLEYLSESRDQEAAERAFKHFSEAECMTDKFFALMALCSMDHPLRQRALDIFYRDAKVGGLEQHTHCITRIYSKHVALCSICNTEPACIRISEDAPYIPFAAVAPAGNWRLLNGWFSVQARADLPNEVERVQQLMQHAAFSFEDADRLRFLLFDFVKANAVHFHRKDGKGYKLLAEAILRLDETGNPLALSTARLFSGWHHLIEDRQNLVQQQLSNVLEVPELSDDVRCALADILWGSGEGTCG